MTHYPSPIALILALAATIVIEAGVLLLLGERRKRVFVASVAMNVATNLPLNFWLIRYGGGWPAIAIGESLVVLIETLCYRCVLDRWSTALIYSVLCNAVSFLVGVLVHLISALLQTT